MTPRPAARLEQRVRRVGALPFSSIIFPRRRWLMRRFEDRYEHLKQFRRSREALPSIRAGFKEVGVRGISVTVTGPYSMGAPFFYPVDGTDAVAYHNTAGRALTGLKTAWEGINMVADDWVLRHAYEILLVIAAAGVMYFYLLVSSEFSRGQTRRPRTGKRPSA